MPSNRTAFSWSLLLLAGTTLAQGDPATADAKALWQQVQKLPHLQQQQALDHLHENLPPHALLSSWQALAKASEQAQHERQKALAHKRPKKAMEFPLEVEPLPRRVDYLFGLGTIVQRDGKPLPAPVPAPKPGAKPTAKPAKASPPDLVPLHQALLGGAPDADKAVAVLLQQLDQDQGADAFAAFVQSWRNGDESFYEALDRTAGSKDGVFFYDAMLGDFRTHFGRGKEGAAIGSSLQAAHDALHDAFLVYRNYRAFREAVAWSLVLPPDVPLPARLARYEAKVAGSYSLRQQVIMVDAALDHDAAKVVAAVNEGASALPQPLWSGKHDPYTTWTPKFAALQATMIERAGSTDAFLQRAEGERRELAATLAKLAADCVHAALGTGKAH